MQLHMPIQVIIRTALVSCNMDLGFVYEKHASVVETVGLRTKPN